MSIVSEIWNQAVHTQSAAPRWLVLATGALALLIVLTRDSWHLARNAITIAHEGGHALVAVLTGRRLEGLRLHSDTSGVTVTVGRPTGPGMICTASAGYVAPPLLGLGAAWLVSSGHAVAVLWASIVLLLAMLVMVRNGYGVLSLALTVAGVFCVSWFAPAVARAGFACLVAWFLLIGGVRPLFELQRLRTRGRARDSDADQLARLTGIPGGLWLTAFGVVAIAALTTGAGWLVP
jgi:hypothetical protein